MPLGAEFLCYLVWSRQERSSGPFVCINSMAYSVPPLMCRVGVSRRHVVCCDVVWYGLIAEIGCLPDCLFGEKERWLLNALAYASFANRKA